MPWRANPDIDRARRVAGRVTAAIRRFRPALIPLFSTRDGRAELIGTGVGVRAGDARLVFGAAHVLRRFETDTIFVPTRAGWRPLTGTTHIASTASVDDPDDDTVDAAVLALDTATSENWPGWLEPEDLLPGSPADPAQRFVVAGFPRSTAATGAGRIAPRAWRYAGTPAPRSRYARVLSQPRLHIALEYRRARILRGDRPAWPPPLYGASGGMLIWAPGLNDEVRTSSNRLAGIFIEEHVAPVNLLVSTRVDVHLALVHDRLPELRRYFPLPRTLTAPLAWRSLRRQAVRSPR
jgi:hypothetical protein